MSMAFAITAAGMPAIAAPDRVEEIAHLIEAVAPDQGQVLQGIVGANDVVATSENARIAVPLDASDPLTLESVSSDSGPPLTVILPDEMRESKGHIADDGTVVYPSMQGGTEAAIQILDDGSARIQTLTSDADGPHSYTYSFGDGILPVSLEDGTIELVEETEDGRISYATVDQAWAMDADGNPVDTHYRVEGNQLTQVIDASDSSIKYPIVADPKIRFGLGVYVYLNSVEKSSYRGFISSIAVLGAAASCGMYLKKLVSVPGVHKVASSICAFSSPVGLYKFFTQVLPTITKTSSLCSEARYWKGKWTTKTAAYSKCMPLNKSHKIG